MDITLLASNFLNPPILFFFLGMLAVLLKSDLEIPQPLPKLFSLYLLFAIGFQGGVKLQESGLNGYVGLCVGVALLMASAVPVYSFLFLRWKMDANNAAGIAATYGSVSAVTFLTAISFLGNEGIAYGGHMVAVMALMESPAIVIGVLLARRFGQESAAPAFSWGKLSREALTNASVFLLLGSMIIGMMTGQAGWLAMKPFAYDIFKGMLTFFLLDIGLVAARRIGDLRKSGMFLILFALVAPVVNALLGMGLARLVGMTVGDAVLFTILCGSASYIAVPAAMRMAVPEANPSLFVSMALAITFPFNIAVGIPLYTHLVRSIWGG